MLDFLSFSEKLFGGLLDLGNAVGIVEVESLNYVVFSVGSSARDGEHKSFGYTVGLSVRVECNGLPFVASESPVAHVVDGGIACGCSG